MSELDLQEVIEKVMAGEPVPHVSADDHASIKSRTKLMVLGHSTVDAESFKPVVVLSFAFVESMKGLVYKEGPSFTITAEELAEIGLTIDDLPKVFGHDVFIWKKEFLQMPHMKENSGNPMIDAYVWIKATANKRPHTIAGNVE